MKVYIAEGAVIAADVTIAENANIWFNTVIRGDVSPIKIGKNKNIKIVVLFIHQGLMVQQILEVILQLVIWL